ncbi:MAG TPA: cytochrome c [Anaerolineales bacterium]|nr:cytochrome c [Anaerolineales bacterium]
MKSDLFKRLSILIGVVVLLFAFLMLFSYDIIKVDWVSFMEIQPAFQPMYHPLPVPTDSIPIEGPAYILAAGVPTNPVPADTASITRGRELYRINCNMCHGPEGEGNGPIANYLQNKPANLSGLAVQSLSDGGIFMTITEGVQGKMPALNENLTVRERWDVVNYVRTLWEK